MKSSVCICLIVIVILSMTMPAYSMAADTAAVTFEDVQPGQWFYTDVMTLTGKGIITGVSAPVNGVGKYDPMGTVTLGQFLAISTRLVAEENIIAVPNAAHWSVPNYNAALKSDLIRKNDFGSTPDALNAPITREDMAYVLVNIAKVNGETLTVISGIRNNINDYSMIKDARKDAVEKAYSNGLIVGDSSGSFKPRQYLTRAEVATVFCRLMKYTARPEVIVKARDTTNGALIREPMVLRYDDPNRPLPMAGDTFIDKDGNATVLVETAGVLGYGQGLNPYIGMKYGDRTLEHEDIGGVWQGDETYKGQPFLIDERTGEAHFRTDWLTISTYEAELTLKIRNPKDGQRAGYWAVYSEDLGIWYWTGPRNISLK